MMRVFWYSAPMKKNVFVGLSGGVDSAVSAALLQERGYDVTGVFIKIWQPEFIECTWREDRLDALRVAAALGIPFREIDLSEEYKRDVIEPMIADYARGITPNPDVLCNKYVKFGHFAKWALGEGAEYVATGHYARTRTEDNRVLLVRGVDAQKDQSYFLHRIESDMLARAIFPVGDICKSEVRAHADRFGLPVAKKPDSQGLCFVGDITMKDFLGRYLTLVPGDVLDVNGTVIGVHDGAALYTRGQRHGFRAEGGVQYVVDVDIARNVIRVSSDRADTMVSRVTLTDVHWIDTVTPPLDIEIQTRYREASIRALVPVSVDDSTNVIFSEPHIVSPGQSLVVYDREVCLGGGIIGISTARHCY